MSNLFDKLNEEQLNDLMGALDTAAALPPGIHGSPYNHERVMWMSREAALAYIDLTKNSERS